MSFNWEFILSFTLAFGLVFVIFMTLGFYISYKRDQRLRRNAIPENPTEGRYFTRFLPEEIASRYSSNDWKEELEGERKLQKKINRAVVIVPFALFLAIGGYFLVAHRDLLFAPVSLTEGEISGLQGKRYDWTGEVSPTVPQYVNLYDDLKSYTIALVYDESDLDWKPDGHVKNPTMEQKSGWMAWGEGLGIKVVECSWSKLDRFCGVGVSSTVFVILPGTWRENHLNQIIRSGGRILLVGAPRQLYSQPLGYYQWHGLKFSREDLGRQDLLVLSGDKSLTLGWDAGTIVDVPAVMRGYVVESSHSQAYRIAGIGEVRGKMTAGLAGAVDGKGRWTWLDYHPLRSGGGEIQSRLVEGLNSSVFRFLLGEPYGNIATWPGGSTVGVLATLSLTEASKEARRFVEDWKSKIPLSLYLTAGVLESERDWIHNKLTALDINCQGSPTEIVDGQGVLMQAQAMLLCRKIASELVDVTAHGYRPYGDLMNLDVITAAQLAGFDYVLAGPHWQLTPDVQVDLSSGTRMVRIGRVSRDAHAYFGREQMSISDIKQAVQKELDWANSLNGMFILSLQDQYLSREYHKDFVQFVDQWVSEKKNFVYLATTGQMNKWWRVRGHLLRGIKITEEERKEFRPHWIQVNSAGELRTEPWTPGRTISSNQGGANK
ncbi:MAG: hypothetical protein H6624_17115 [Bdellovibrionaceae bacterium]|nr:hypothetical protein [Bdellovibrionales bacterium]MCB9086068.1 hypothetical protein [Pseudobdellovibrionaceae bacterium]